jgi:hypothetical protein
MDSLDQYVADLKQVDDFLASHPTLVHQRVHFGNGRLSDPEAPGKWIGETVHNAGMSFLERIHAEIDDAQPQWVKDAKQKELDELAGKGDFDDTPYVPPPLNEPAELPPDE